MTKAVRGGRFSRAHTVFVDAITAGLLRYVLTVYALRTSTVLYIV